MQLPHDRRVTRNHHLIINYKFLQNTIWICSKFVGALQIAIDLVISSICVICKCNAVSTLGIFLKDGKRIYLGCTRGYTSNPANGGILDTVTNSKQPEKKSTSNHMLDHNKEL